MSDSLQQSIDRLNPAQRDAVTSQGVPLLVLAGPGSGKTRVITHRIAYLVGPKHYPSSSILAVTFTNKAAREMTDRLRLLIPGDHQYLTVGTFHAICARILRRDGTAIGIPCTFTITDDDDQESLVRRAIKDLDLDDKRNPPRAFMARISAAKSKLIDPATYRLTADNYADELVASVFERYQKALDAANLLDFDDLLGQTVRLFREAPRILEAYQEKYLQLLVDEFQDTNIAQYAIVRLLGDRHRNVCVVGDEDQSVYSWRQADIRNILNFEIDFPDARLIVLEQNYRSSRTILPAARAVISPNRERKDKKLFTENASGDRVVVFEAYDENEEANYVVTQIERAVAAGTVRLGEIAVMYRVNSQSRVLEKMFLRRRIPHRVVGVRFYHRKEIRDLLGYLRLCNNPRDVASFDRIINVPARSIGAKTLSDLRQWSERLGITPPEAVLLLSTGQEPPVPCPVASRAKAALTDFGRCLIDLHNATDILPVSKLIDTILKRTGYLDSLNDGTANGDARVENVRELIQVAAEFDQVDGRASLEAFLEDAALAADADEYDAAADSVTLITLHAAKGLEFGHVFLVGLEEGMCPHSRSVDEPSQLEEERRLLYVGVTRARHRLFLTYAARRTQFGDSSERQPSRFFRDIPAELLQGTAPAIQARRPNWTTSSGATGTTGLKRPVIVKGVQTPRTAFLPSAEGQEPISAASGVTVGAKALPALRAGNRVGHPTFGEGIVVSVEDRGDDRELTVAFPDLPVKRLLQSYAKLTLL
jgi:DNA helicase-2/ATP-dependent DNA helicase PcrA